MRLPLDYRRGEGGGEKRDKAVKKNLKKGVTVPILIAATCTYQFRWIKIIIIFSGTLSRYVYIDVPTKRGGARIP